MSNYNINVKNWVTMSSLVLQCNVPDIHGESDMLNEYGALVKQ